MLARMRCKARERQRNRYALFHDARRVQRKHLKAWNIAAATATVLRRYEHHVCGYEKRFGNGIIEACSQRGEVVWKHDLFLGFLITGIAFIDFKSHTVGF